MNKEQLLSKYFQENYADYLELIAKITKTKQRNTNMNYGDIFTIIFLNLHKRLSKIDDKHFENKDAFRAVFLNSLIKQVSWSVSDINSFNSFLNGQFEDLTSEDNEETQYSDRKINNKYFEQEIHDEDNNDEDNKYEFIKNEFQDYLLNNNDKLLYEIVVDNNFNTYKKIQLATGINLTTSTKLLKDFRDKANFIYENKEKIKNKQNLSLISDLHPNIRLFAIEFIQKNQNILIIKSSQQKKDIINPELDQYFQNGLAIEIDGIIKENNIIIFSKLTSEEIKYKIQIKDFIPSTKWIKL